MQETKIGIVILNYNTWEETIKCVFSLQNNTRGYFHIYIIDNKSTDSSMSQLEQFVLGKPFITLMQARKNNGYSAGNNIGIKAAIKDNCDVIFILNSDVELLNDAIDKMAHTLLENDNIMLIGPSVKNNEGVESQQVKRKLTWETYIFGRKPYCHIPYFKKKGNRDYAVGAERLFIFNGMLLGCCFGIRSKDIEALGYLDENVFLYYEEDILAYKIEWAGKMLAVDYDAKIWHKESVSTGKRGLPFIQYHFWTSALYVLKYYAKASKLQLAYLVATNIFAWAILSCFLKEYRKHLKSFAKKNMDFIKAE